MVNWISLSQTAGTGNATITVTASSYSELLERSTSLVVSGISRSANVNIIQQFNNDFYISPTNISGVPSSGINYYYITITSNTSWSIVSGPNWLSFNELSGSGSTTISMLADANSGVARTGDVVFENANGLQRTLSVAQVAADEPVVSINLNPSSISVPSSGGSYSLTVTSNGAWTLSVPAWITLSANSGSGDTVVTVTISPNTGNTQGGTIVGSTTNDSSSCSVTQYGNYVYPYANLGDDAFSFNYEASTTGTTLETNISWYATTDVNWLSFTPSSGNSGNYNITISATENTGDNQREGHIYIRNSSDNSVLAIITISQSVNVPPAGPNDYLTLKFISSGTFMYNTFSHDEYNLNDNGWVSADGSAIDVNYGDIVKVRAQKYSSGSCFSGTALCIMEGNPLSLIYGSAFTGQTDYSYSYSIASACSNYLGVVDARNMFVPGIKMANFFEGCTNLVYPPLSLSSATTKNAQYMYMFSGCTSLVNAPSLPSTSLSNNCYNGMFEGCTSLTTPPLLPATSIADSCYERMFYGCTSLQTAPSLPSTVLQRECYRSMFEGCTSLTTPSSISATTLAQSCCQNMFAGCTSLQTAPSLPATALTETCYQGMFQGCSNLVNAPSLPATSLGNSCYRDMFRDCTSLVNAPSLPATTATNGCYNGMFYGCTSMVVAPSLPATVLGVACYANMFYGCTSLTTPPSSLDASYLYKNCYRAMFEGCTGLTYSPVLPALRITNGCYVRMFYGCTNLSTITCNANTLSNVNESLSDCTNSWIVGVQQYGDWYGNSGSPWVKNNSYGIPLFWTTH